MMSIRLARRRDVTTIAGMSRVLIESGLGWSWTPQRVGRALADSATNVIVAEQAKRVVGFALMKYLEEHAHLLLFAVAADQQRRGIGRALWQWLERTARVAGIGTVHLEVRARNVSARHFYRTLGFTEAEVLRGYYRGIEPALRMRCTLSVPARSDHP